MGEFKLELDFRIKLGNKNFDYSPDYITNFAIIHLFIQAFSTHTYFREIR